MHRLTSLLFAVAASTPLFAGELDGRFQADLAGGRTGDVPYGRETRHAGRSIDPFPAPA